MVDIQRITTEYVDSEDRIRLTGESAHGQVVVLWLTQRLLNRLLVHLLSWLERYDSQAGSGQSIGNVFQGFAQQAAMAALPLQSPVLGGAAARVLLVLAVDLNISEEGVRLIWRDGAGRPHSQSGDAVALFLHAQALRQWLGIVHGIYLEAGWPPAIWPEWVSESAGTMTSTGRTHWH